MKAIRWSDNDRYFGPFTYARDRRSYRPLGACLTVHTCGQNQFRVSAFGHTLLCPLPSILTPYCAWVDTSKYGWSDNPDGGYWSYHSRAYGAFMIEGAVHIDFGAQTHDSTTTKTKVWFLPWRGMRHIRRSLYGLAGEHVADLPEHKTWLGRPHRWNVEQAIVAVCPTAQFNFADFDGQLLVATTRIEEREWARGEGYFKWLSLFTRNHVRRSLDIQFSGETGKRKGSWKGGTIGHSIDMLPGELHEPAFRRYCAQNQMTLVGAAE